MSVMILAVVARSHKRNAAAIGATNRVATSQSSCVEGSGSTATSMTAYSVSARVSMQTSAMIVASLRGAAIGRPSLSGGAVLLVAYFVHVE